MSTIAARPTGVRVPASQAVALAVVVTAAAAWAAMALTHGTALDHHALGGLLGGHAHGGAGHHPAPSAGLSAAALVLLGWAVMVVAMMLPPALPLLQTVRRLVARRRTPGLLVAWSALVLVGVWTLVGLLLIVGDAGLHRLVEETATGDLATRLVPAGLLAAAGTYQLTPLKRSCLRACRSPRSFALAHWTGRRTPAGAVAATTASYAVACVGCCWAPMAVSLAVGAAMLPAMVALAVVMAAERLVPWGRRLVVPVGIALLALAALTLTGVLPVAAH